MRLRFARSNIGRGGESDKNYQVDLLKEILNLQADMVVMLLSMLEGEDYCFRDNENLS